MNFRLALVALALAIGLLLIVLRFWPDVAFNWQIPDNYPEPAVPVDNPMSREKVRLGRLLFYDKRLSINGTFSCGSCHKQSLAFTDGLPRSVRP